MKTVFLCLIFPVLLLAQTENKRGSTLTVKVSEVVKQPSGTIDRVSKRTLNSLTFERDSIGSGRMCTVISTNDPLCWDSAGKMVKIDLSEHKAKTKDYQHSIKIGPSEIEYDSLGNMLYTKGGQTLEIRPLFKGVKSIFEPQNTKIKATYYLDKDMSLEWRLIDPYHMATRKIPAFSAWDATGKPVNLIEVRTDTSLSVKLKSDGEITWPVAIDPTVLDTFVVNKGLSMGSGYSTSYTTVRSKTSAVSSNGTQVEVAIGQLFNGTVHSIWRTAVSFNLRGLPSASSLDSASITFRWAANQPPNDTTVVIVAQGTFSGDTTSAWYKAFTGWKGSDSVYTLREYVNSPYIVPFKSGSIRTTTTSINSNGLTDILAKWGTDTLRVILLDKKDRDATPAPSGLNQSIVEATPISPYPYLSLYYNGGTPATFSAKVAGISPSKVNGIVPSKVLGIQ